MTLKKDFVPKKRFNDWAWELQKRWSALSSTQKRSTEPVDILNNIIREDLE